VSWPRLRGEPQLFRIEKKMVRGLEVSLCQLFHYDDKTPEAHPELASNSDGPLIVLEPGQKYRPEHNRTFVFNTGRYAPFGLMLLVNGTPQPDPLVGWVEDWRHTPQVQPIRCSPFPLGVPH
jgi:hypothetical protein